MSENAAVVPAIVAQKAAASLERARTEQAQVECLNLHNSAEMFVLQKASCPESVAQLVEAKLISRAMVDPWGGEYAVTCTGRGESLRVSSAGPDKRAGTDDDVRCPSP